MNTQYKKLNSDIKNKRGGIKGQSTWLKLSCNQPKIDCNIYKIFYVSGNHKAKTHSRFTKDKQKGIKAYQYGKSSIPKVTREGEKNKGTRKQPENSKISFISLYLSITIINVNGLNSLIKRVCLNE